MKDMALILDVRTGQSYSYEEKHYSEELQQECVSLHMNMSKSGHEVASYNERLYFSVQDILQVQTSHDYYLIRCSN